MRETSKKQIERYTPPTPLHKEPRGTIWKVKDGLPEFYIQVNKASKKVRWMRMGMFLEIALQQLFLDEKFMNMCAGLFQCNEQKR